jgi:Tfp pilus assembly protein PilF
MSRKSTARRQEIAAKPQHAQVALRERGEPLALSQRWGSWLIPVLIALVTLTAFLPSLQNGFVGWDDATNFLDNPHYRGLAWTHLRWMWTTHLGHYIPLTWMTFGLDYLLWGMNPFGYHLTSLLLHAANAVVFFFLVRRLLRLALPSRSERGHALVVSAGFAALMFAIHPLRVESVAWATERRDILSGLFYLATILMYLRACEEGARSRGWYWLSVAVFVCALLSKSMVVNLPVVLLILDVYPLRRLGGFVGWWSAPARRVYAEKIPFVLLAAAASAIAVMAQSSVHSAVSLAQLSVAGRLAISTYGLSFYLWKMVVPLNLSPLYELRPPVNPGATPFILSYGIVVAITALALVLRRRVPGLPAAWLAYVVVLVPVLGIFQSGPQIAADRYTYLAGFGWTILAGASMLSCWQTSRRSETGTPITLSIASVAICLVVGFGVLTWNQAQVWHESERLWTHALAIDPDSFVAHGNLGTALAQKGKLAEAIDHYREALRIKPDYADALYNLGVALAEQGKLAEAVEHYQQALKIRPDYPEALNNLGVALSQQGKPAEASERFRQALKIKPDDADAHHNWGVALALQGKLAEASEHFRQALRIRPNYAKALPPNFGAALADQSKLAEAIEHYRQALQIKPDSAEVHTNRGLALAAQGKLAEASEHYQKALRLKPDYVDAHNSWGAALAQQGKLAEAIDRYRQALKIKPDSAEVHNNLGAALADQSKLAEAIEHYRQALKIKPDSAEVHTNWGLALAAQGKLAEAIEHYRQALQIKPDSAEVHTDWGLALAAQGKLAEAIEHYQKALRLKPDHAEAHNSWGAALAQQGQLAEAIDHYRQALQIKPDYADAHNNWGAALGQQGQPAEAIHHFRQALRIKPDHADAHHNWGNALAQQGKLAEASEHYRQALKIGPVGPSNTTSRP